MPLEEKIRELAIRPPPPNERSARAYIVYPLLTHLGWYTDDPSQVAFDQLVGARRVDIALKSRGRDVAYLITMTPGTPLPAHAQRILHRTARGEAIVLVLTTGVEWRLYLAEEDDKAAAVPFATLDIRRDSPDAVAEGLQRYIGHEALHSGSAEARARSALTEIQNERRIRAALPEVWDGMVTRPDPELVSLVQRRMRARTGLETKSSLVAAMLGGLTSTRQTVGPDRGVPSRPAPQKNQTRKPGLKPTSWRLWGTEKSVGSWVGVLLGVFRMVHDRHESGFLDAAQTLWGKRRPWISLDETVLRNPQAITDTGLYVTTEIDARSIERRCRRLLEHFGHDPDDLEIVVGARVARDEAGAAGLPSPRSGAKARRTRRPGAKPVSWHLWGEETRVSTWIEVLVGVFEVVQSRHGIGFLEAARPLWGAHRPWIATDKGELLTPRAIVGTGLYVDAAMSAAAIRDRCRRLLTHFGHDADELKITLREPAGTADSPPPKPAPRRTRRRRRWR